MKTQSVARQNVGRGGRLVLSGSALLSPLFLLCIVSNAQLPNPSNSAAQAFAPAPGQKFFLDLDSAPGTFSVWRTDDLGSMNSMQAIIRVIRLRKDPSWQPAFSIGLADSASEVPRNSLFVQVFTESGKAPMKIRLTGKVDGKAIQAIQFQGTVGLNEELHIALAWGSGQEVTFNVADTETRTIRAPWQVKSAIVTGSTGEFRVQQLLLGATLP
jgi:hypothetical protein